MIDPILDRCVDEFTSSPGSSAEKMGAVLEYLAEELIRDAFPNHYNGNLEVFIDAVRLRRRLLDAVKDQGDVRTASYEPDLARLKGEVPPRIKEPSDFPKLGPAANANPAEWRPLYPK